MVAILQGMSILFAALTVLATTRLASATYSDGKVSAAQKISNYYGNFPSFYILDSGDYLTPMITSEWQRPVLETWTGTG